MERLDKRLAGTGRWTRKEARALIRAGRVFVDGVAVCRPEEKCEAGCQISVDGEQISCEHMVYLMLYKPAGLISATEDPRQPTVLTLVPDYFRRIGLFPAGRLDKDTEGLLLLTNDGSLAHQLLAPKNHVDKTYFVQVDGVLEEEDRKAFQTGVTLADGYTCLPARLELVGPSQGLITLYEGKYHQIKRMLASRGKPVTYLKRLTMGPLVLDPELKAGEWRPLTEEELEQLREWKG